MYVYNLINLLYLHIINV